MHFSSYPVRELDRMGYTSLYVRRNEDSYTHRLQKSYGFKTTSLTRPVAIARLVELMRSSPHLVCDGETLEEMLVACAGEKKTLTSEDFKIIVSKGTKQVRLCCDLPSAGISQIPMFITDGGYLLMTWCGENIYFDIGKEKANEIIDHIEKNGTVQVYDDNILITETTKR